MKTARRNAPSVLVPYGPRACSGCGVLTRGHYRDLPMCPPCSTHARFLDECYAASICLDPEEVREQEPAMEAFFARLQLGRVRTGFELLTAACGLAYLWYLAGHAVLQWIHAGGFR